MLSEKQHQAKNLYFQTDLTKTQIADLLNVSRRTLHYWIRQNNWDRLKSNSAIMPAMLAENCYAIIANYTEALLSEIRIKRPVSLQEAETLHKLSLTVKKLKNHSTLNETMEIFAHFIERVNRVSPELADQVMPFVSDYMEEQAAINPALYKPEKLNEQGYIPYTTDHDPTEIQKDIADMMEWERESGLVPEVDIEAFRIMDKDTASETATPA